MSGVHELLNWPVELIQRGGKPAGAAAIVIGTALVPGGLWLAFGLLGPGYYWPVMLGVSAFGVGLAVVGLAAFFGVRARLADFDVEAGTTPVASVPVTTATLPFWVCGSCKIVREGVSVTQRCEQCGSITDFMPVEHESERKLAVGLLS